MIEGVIYERNLLDEHLGGIWFTFKDFLTSSNVELLEKAYNLICIYNEDLDLSLELANILNDDNVDIFDKQSIFMAYMVSNLLMSLRESGIILDEEQLENNDIKYLIRLATIALEIEAPNTIEDFLDILMNGDQTNIERIILLYQQKYNVFDENGDECYFLEKNILDVTDDYIEGLIAIIINSYNIEDDNEDIEMKSSILHVENRVIKYKSYFNNSFAETHIKNEGMLGLNINSLESIFKSNLNRLENENYSIYLKEIFLLSIISEMKDKEIIAYMDKHIDQIKDISESMKYNKIVKDLISLLEVNDER